MDQEYEISRGKKILWPKTNSKNLSQRKNKSDWKSHLENIRGLSIIYINQEMNRQHRIPMDQVSDVVKQVRKYYHGGIMNRGGGCTRRISVDQKSDVSLLSEMLNNLKN